MPESTTRSAWSTEIHRSLWNRSNVICCTTTIYGTPCSAAFEEVARRHRKYQLEDSGHWARWHFGVCRIQGRGPGFDARVGRRAAGLRHKSECGCSRRSDDSVVPAMAEHVSEPRREGPNHPFQDSA